MSFPDDPDVHAAYILHRDSVDTQVLKRLPQQQARLHRLYAQSMKELRALQAARLAESQTIEDASQDQAKSALASQPAKQSQSPASAPASEPASEAASRVNSDAAVDRAAHSQACSS